MRIGKKEAIMQYKNYLDRVEFDAEANVFHGEVINIRDVVTFQDKSVGEFKKAFEESVEEYLAFCSERGEEPDKPFTGCFTIRLSPDQHKKVVLAAEKSRKEIDLLVTDVLAQDVN